MKIEKSFKRIENRRKTHLKANFTILLIYVYLCYKISFSYYLTHFRKMKKKKENVICQSGIFLNYLIFSSFSFFCFWNFSTENTYIFFCAHCSTSFWLTEVERWTRVTCDKWFMHSRCLSYSYSSRQRCHCRHRHTHPIFYTLLRKSNTNLFVWQHESFLLNRNKVKRENTRDFYILSCFKANKIN